MVFDKTGTLTEDGLQIFGYRDIVKSHIDKHNAAFGEFVEDCSVL